MRSPSVATYQTGRVRAAAIEALKDDESARSLLLETFESTTDENDPGGWVHEALVDVLKVDARAQPAILVLEQQLQQFLLAISQNCMHIKLLLTANFSVSNVPC